MYPLIESMLEGFKTIFRSPSNDWSVLWLLAPILLFWIVLEVYFDRHKKEALGWNTALGNGLSLFWVAISCVRFVFASIMEHGVSRSFGLEVYWRMVWIFVIFAYSIFVISVSFSHKMKDKWVYMLAAPTPIYFLSIVIVLFAYGVLEFTWIIMFDLFLLYWIILGFELLVRRFTPEDTTNSGNNTLDDSSSSSGSDPFGSSSSSSDPFGSSSTTSSDPFSSTSSSNSSSYGGQSSYGSTPSQPQNDPFGSSGSTNNNQRSNDDFKF